MPGYRPRRGRGQASSPLKNTTDSSAADSNCENPGVEASQHAEKIDARPTIKNETSKGRNDTITSLNLKKGTRVGDHGSTSTPAGSRFKPKNVRRSATELAELAHKDELRKATAIAELAREQARLARGRGRPRGRGDTMGRGRGASGNASSIFGIAPEGLKKVSGMVSLRTGGGSGGTGSSNSAGKISIKSRGPDNSGSSYVRHSGKNGNIDFSPQYPGEDDDAIRVDIEHINLISDDDEEIIHTSDQMLLKKAKSMTKSGLKPIRLHREEHKERAAIVNTSSHPSRQSKNNSEEGLFVDDASGSKTLKAEVEEISVKGGNQDRLLEPQIKEESSYDLSIDSIRLSSSIIDSVQTGKNLNSESEPKIGASSRSIPSAQPYLTGDSTMNIDPHLIKNSQQPIKKKERKPVLQTEEDRAEYERYLEDISILVNELGGLQDDNLIKSQDSEGDIKINIPDASLSEVRDKKEGRLYMFQFPPVLPALYNPLTEQKPGSDINIKQETDEGTSLENIKGKNLDPSKSNLKGKGKAKEVDVTTNPPIKLEIEVEDAHDKKQNITEREELVREEGYIGKLVVRESGRVELCWGGTSLLVGRGVDAGFLTTGVIVDSVERGPQGGGVPEGKALGMGQIMGKFVVTPDWQSMT